MNNIMKDKKFFLFILIGILLIISSITLISVGTVKYIEKNSEKDIVAGTTYYIENNRKYNIQTKNYSELYITVYGTTYTNKNTPHLENRSGKSVSYIEYSIGTNWVSYSFPLDDDKYVLSFNNVIDSSSSSFRFSLYY